MRILIRDEYENLIIKGKTKRTVKRLSIRTFTGKVFIKWSDKILPNRNSNCFENSLEEFPVGFLVNYWFVLIFIIFDDKPNKLRYSTISVKVRHESLVEPSLAVMAIL